MLRATRILIEHIWYTTTEAINRKERASFSTTKRGMKKYLSVDSESWKISPRHWPFRNYPCKACGKTFTLCHALHVHQKKITAKTQKQNNHQKRNAKDMVKWYAEQHILLVQKKGCPESRRPKKQFVGCGEMLSKRQFIIIQRKKTRNKKSIKHLRFTGIKIGTRGVHESNAQHKKYCCAGDNDLL